jgi:transcriptional regulator with XRE-family HTH domain
MQAISLTEQDRVYAVGMQTGRPSNKKRPPFGARLHALREQAGLSQQQMADKLGLSQRAYAYWERNPVALRPEQLVKVAAILDVGVEQLLNGHSRTARRGGPAGKARRVFEEVSGMPRTQQKKILDVVEALVAQAKVAH